MPDEIDIQAEATQVLDRESIGDAFTVVREEPLDASAFLNLVRREPSAIKHVKVVPPRIGDRRSRFGQFIVEYAMPRLRKRPHGG